MGEGGGPRGLDTIVASLRSRGIRCRLMVERDAGVGVVRAVGGGASGSRASVTPQKPLVRSSMQRKGYNMQKRDKRGEFYASLGFT